MNKVQAEQAKARYQKAQQHLPDVYADKERPAQAELRFAMKGFIRIQDRHCFERVLDALQASPIAKVFDLLSQVFDCDRSEICLLEDHIATRKGEKVPVVYFYYTYNQSFNDVLKSTGNAFFNPRVKAWNIVLDDNAKEIVGQSIGNFYRVVIDLSRMIIMQNEKTPNQAAQTRMAFDRMPFHIPVRKSEIISAIMSSRPGDFILDDRIYINDGSEFVPYPDRKVIWTQLPFLLLRYPVPDGKPRYVSFSTLGKVVEYVSFGNDSKETSMMIARFMCACRILKMPAFELEDENIIHPDDNLKNRLQGNFDRFSKSIEIVRSVIPDMGIAPLCSDYVTLVSQNHGADSKASNIIAYISPPNKQYLAKIAEFFGHTTEDYPIVFTRSMLDEWNDQQDFQFLLTVAHELAHWLVFEMRGEIPDEDAHGVAWAICQDLLEYLFVEEYSMTEYAKYHPDNHDVIMDIERVVNDVGIPALEGIRSSRPLSKDDIKRVTRDCLSALNPALM